MNVASLDLCKELYELSGWIDAPWAYQLEVGKRGLEAVEVVDNSHWGGISRHLFEKDTITGREPAYLPAYDLGYLLRKLPEGCSIHKKENGYRWSMNHITDECTDTPEDAACKLAIELFKQGVL